MKKESSDLIRIASEIGARPDFVQGGGGNFSVKLADGKMLIKASGYRFSEVGERGGIVSVDNAKLLERYKVSPGKKWNEKEEADFLFSVSESERGERPSMEAGFHAFLGKYVLHTHSVYTNIISCSKNGGARALEICSEIGIPAAYLPYANPGPELAAEIAGLIVVPRVIFLKNHGLIISGDSAEEVLALHEKVNSEFKKSLNLKDYPAAGIVPENNLFKSQGQFLKIFFSGKERLGQFIDFVIFPDQVVFCDKAIFDGAEGRPAKIKIDETGNIFYSTAEKEAVAIDELLLAWAYIIGSIEATGMEAEAIPDEAASYIKNMEAEKYRKKLLNQK